MHFPGVGSPTSPEVEHDFPWDDWMHKTNVIDMGFYTVILSNVAEELLTIVIGNNDKRFSDLFRMQALGRRPKR